MIKGKLTTLRPIEAADQEFLHLLNADPAVRSNVVGWDFPQSLHGQERWFQNAQSASSRRWIVEDSEGRPIGLTGLWDIDWHNRNAKSALKIGGPNEIRGRGLGRDAIKTLMAFAFYDVGLERVYGAMLETNHPSLRVYCDHCNWQIEGTSRRHIWRHGEFVDLIQVGVLKREFDSLPDSSEYIQLMKAGRV